MKKMIITIALIMGLTASMHAQDVNRVAQAEQQLNEIREELKRQSEAVNQLATAVLKLQHALGIGQQQGQTGTQATQTQAVQQVGQQQQ